jgi:hypothetical protein
MACPHHQGNFALCPGSILSKIMAKCENNKWAMLAAFLAVVPISFALSSSGRQSIKPSERSSKVVVITGCDTGFGLLAAQELHKQGYLVVAACLTADGCARLAGKVTKAVQCDVTSQDSLDNLAREVQNLLTSTGKSNKLWAVINNAGIGLGGNIDWLTMAATRQVLEVNFFGAVATTKSFLPLLKRCKDSRIVNISSLAGLSGAQMLSAYCGKISMITKIMNLIIFLQGLSMPWRAGARASDTN